jgi:hypothetical protein
LILSITVALKCNKAKMQFSMRKRVTIFLFTAKPSTVAKKSYPKRERKPVERFCDLTFSKGANNKFTAGRRPIDPYDRMYMG